jgi:hypothetical protein
MIIFSKEGNHPKYKSGSATTPPIGPNLIIITHARRPAALCESKLSIRESCALVTDDKSFTQSYSHEPFLFYHASAEIFVMDHFRLFRRPHILSAIPIRDAGVVEASEFLPSAISASLNTAQEISCLHFKKWEDCTQLDFRYIPNPNRQPFHHFFLPSPRLSYDNPVYQSLILKILI